MEILIDEMTVLKWTPGRPKSSRNTKVYMVQKPWAFDVKREFSLIDRRRGSVSLIPTLTTTQYVIVFPRESNLSEN